MSSGEPPNLPPVVSGGGVAQIHDAIPWAVFVALGALAFLTFILLFLVVFLLVKIGQLERELEAGISSARGRSRADSAMERRIQEVENVCRQLHEQFVGSRGRLTRDFERETRPVNDPPPTAQTGLQRDAWPGISPVAPRSSFDPSRAQDRGPADDRARYGAPEPSKPAPRPASDQDAIADLLADPETVGVLQRYNKLAADDDRRGMQAFGLDHGASTASVVGDDLFLDDTGSFWLVDIGSETYCLVVPTAQIARDWNKLYRGLNGTPARNALSAFFDIQEGDVLTVVQPGWAKRIGETWRRLDRGTLAGV